MWPVTSSVTLVTGTTGGVSVVGVSVGGGQVWCVECATPDLHTYLR